MRGTIIITGAGADARQADEKNKQVIFTNCETFNDCVSKINNKQQVDTAKDLDVVMSMYNLIEYRDDYSKHLEVYGNITEMSQMLL